MSKQTFVMTTENYPRPLEVLGEHAAVLASDILCRGALSSRVRQRNRRSGHASETD